MPGKDPLLKQKLPIIILIAASLLLLAYITPSFLHNKTHEMSNNQAVASHIYGLIAGNIERPIGICTGLSSDEFLIRALEREGQTPDKEMEMMMTSFLSAVSNQFGYDEIFVVSDNSKHFYTSKGIAKIVNPQQDPYDNWYPAFLENKMNLQVASDRDQLFDYRWSIFINAKIIGTDGKIIGVCGIGLPMDAWQKMLSQVEKEYKVKINLIDNQGLVQVDTNYSNIRNAYISEALSDSATEQGFTHTEKGRNGFRMTRYMPNLHWYIVVQGNNFIEAQIAGAIAIILINIFLILAVILLLIEHKKVLHHDLIKTSLPEDELTGLPNRNYIKEAYGELGVFNTTRYKSLAVFDIDHFKVVNEARNGDKIILEIVEIAKNIFSENGIMFRYSGDEFVLFLEIDSNEAMKKLQNLCIETKEKMDVTISAGLTDVDLSVTIKTNYYRAVQACYAIKEAGGDGVEKK